MHATTRATLQSAIGSPAASASATGIAGEPAAAARASVGDRSTPKTCRPAARSCRPARPSPHPRSRTGPSSSGKISRRAGQVPSQNPSCIGARAQAIQSRAFSSQASASVTTRRYCRSPPRRSHGGHAKVVTCDAAQGHVINANVRTWQPEAVRHFCENSAFRAGCKRQHRSYLPGASGDDGGLESWGQDMYQARGWCTPSLRQRAMDAS